MSEGFEYVTDVISENSGKHNKLRHRHGRSGQIHTVSHTKQRRNGHDDSHSGRSVTKHSHHTVCTCTMRASGKSKTDVSFRNMARSRTTEDGSARTLQEEQPDIQTSRHPDNQTTKQPNNQTTKAHRLCMSGRKSLRISQAYDRSEMVSMFAMTCHRRHTMLQRQHQDGTITSIKHVINNTND